ncbi:MAG TPA: HepT-like ribonuclease domain-containing protein [Thermoplasmata archaeon]|nr:HepT-like ribonuclease domain-containing protein [Thermoplasmata archaeon]
MVEAAAETIRDAAGGKDEFLKGGLLQKAVILDLIHLTESAEKTSRGLRRLNPKIPWQRMNKLRKFGLVHDYGTVDLEDVWAFVQRELPGIRRQLERLTYPSES